jgi:hypothetical protein
VIIRAFLVKQPDLASVSQNTLNRGRCRPVAYDSIAELEIGFWEVAACAVQNLSSAFGSSSYWMRLAP